MTDWLPPFADLPAAPPPPARPPERVRDAQAPGITTRPVDALCCPACYSLRALKREMPAGSARITWQCRDCGHRWPLPATSGKDRVSIA